MNKKTMIGIIAAVTAVVLSVIVFLCISVSGKTKEAKAAAAEFTKLLKNGEIERLSVEYYMYDPEENMIYTDENGVVKGQTLTKQQVAEIYGVDAVMGNTEENFAEDEDTITKEGILKIIMANTQMVSSVGTVWGESGEMDLQMLVPDIKTWLLGLTDEELQIFNAIESNREFLEEMDARMKDGEIAPQYLRLSIPMEKQNGKWRFRVTEETEQTFFGCLYNLFDTEEPKITEY